jgi:hypothetical protein
MAEDSLSISALAPLAQEDPQQLQLHADKIRHLDAMPMLERISLDTSDQNDG